MPRVLGKLIEKMVVAFKKLDSARSRLFIEVYKCEGAKVVCVVLYMREVVGVHSHCLQVMFFGCLYIIHSFAQVSQAGQANSVVHSVRNVDGQEGNCLRIALLSSFEVVHHHTKVAHAAETISVLPSIRVVDGV